jgi:hypothetical protein
MLQEVVATRRTVRARTGAGSQRYDDIGRKDV